MCSGADMTSVAKMSCSDGVGRVLEESVGMVIVSTYLHTVWSVFLLKSKVIDCGA